MTPRPPVRLTVFGTIVALPALLALLLLTALLGLFLVGFCWLVGTVIGGALGGWIGLAVGALLALGALFGRLTK